MDASLCAKPRTPISSISLSSSHLFLPTSLRREFLGCGRQLRPPGLRSRRKCRKLGFRTQPPRCIFQASLYRDPLFIVAVAIATFTVLRIFYLNYTSRRRRASELSDQELPDVLASFELSKQASNMMEHGALTTQFPGIGNTCALTSMKERKDIVDESCENVHSEKCGDSGIEVAKLQKFQTTSLTCEEIVAEKMSQQPGNEVLTSCLSENLLLKATGDTGLIYPSEMDKEPNHFAVDIIAELLLGKQEGVVAVSEAPGIIIEPTFPGSVSPVHNTCTEFSQENELKHVIAEKSDVQVSSPNVLFRKFVREVSDFNEEIQPEMRSISEFKRLNTTSLHITLQDNNRFHSRRSFSVKGRKDSPLATEYLEERVSFACHQDNSASKGKYIDDVKGFRRNNGTKLMHENNNRKLSRATRTKDPNDPSVYISTYNRLLREARLSDCIELLESMDRKGLLDMDKVYHARFLKACKSRKAVKEAFYFTKLIKKPSLSTYNMLLSVCASSQDSEGAFQVLLLVKEAGLKPDCQLYTTLISTCAKSGKVDAMFEVFHEMVNAGVEPNVHTYGALIDGCARAGQVAKAFGAYGIMRSKKVKPDRVVFNALITACGQSGAVDRAFDVLAEMRAEPQPIDPDHVTVGALMKTCTQSGQADRAREVYKMLHPHDIKGTPEVYTIAVSSCSQKGDLEFALSIYDDMTRNGVAPDEMFLSTLADVAGHAGKVDVGFEILQDARRRGMQLGNVSYSSLMGACCNAKNWPKALELHEDIKTMKLIPTVSTLNALVTSLCDGDQLLKAVEVLDEMKEAGVKPNTITYSILLVACEKKDEVELGFKLLSQAKKDGIALNLIMCRCLTGLCLRRFEKAYSLGEPILSFNSGKPQIDSKWTSWAITVYRETIAAGVIPTIEVFSQVLGCLQFPRDTSLRQRFLENLGVSLDTSRRSNLYSLLDGFGEYDPRSFSILEEAASLGVVPRASFKESPIVVDARKLQIHTIEVYLLTILKGLKHRLAAGARLPNITILLPIEKTRIMSAKGEKTINLAGRVGQAAGCLLRRLGLPYHGDESYGKIRINGLSLRRWFKPKLTSSSFGGKPAELTSSQTRLAKGITDQQRSIRSSNNFSLE